MSRRFAFIVIAFAFLFASRGAPAQTVLSRARLGNNIEDISFIGTGRLAGNLALMNGSEIYLASLRPPGGPSALARQTKFFDVRSTAVENGPRGLAYIDSQKLLAFHSAGNGTLYLVDEKGVFQGTRPMIFPGPAATYLEGMDYLPKSSSFYPDHLIVVANWFGNDTQHPRIEVVRLDGTVEAEIFPQPFGGPQPDGSFLFDPTSGLLGLAYKAPDRLLVTDGATGNVWALDFNGNVVGGGPAYTDTAAGIFEGMVQVPDGRVVLTDYSTGGTLFLDRNMNRLPAQDRTYSVGVGVPRPFGLAWNTDNDSHVLLTSPFGLSTAPSISTVPSTLDSAAIVAFPGPLQNLSRLTYLPGEHLAAAYGRRPIAPGGPFHWFIRLFDPSTGTLDSEVDVTAALSGGSPLGIAYIPTTTEFAVGVSGGATPDALVIVSRLGAFVRAFGPPTGLGHFSAVAFFDPSYPGGGRFLVTDNVNAVILDFAGNALPGGFNLRAGLNVLGSHDLSTITTGLYAGSLGLVDLDNSEVVVFTLP